MFSVEVFIDFKSCLEQQCTHGNNAYKTNLIQLRFAEASSEMGCRESFLGSGKRAKRLRYKNWTKN